MLYHVEPDQCFLEGTHMRQVDREGCCVRCGEEELLQSIAEKTMQSPAKPPIGRVAFPQ